MSDTAVRLKGHAYKGVQSNVYGDHRHVCECGDEGFPVTSVETTHMTHRMHKKSLIARRGLVPAGDCPSPVADNNDQADTDPIGPERTAQ